MISTILTFGMPVCREVIPALFSLLLLSDGYKISVQPRYPGIIKGNDFDIDKYYLF